MKRNTAGMREFLEELKGVTAWSEDLKRDVSTRIARGEELMGYLHRALIHEVTNRIIDRCNQNETTTLGERIAKVGNYRNGHVDDRPQPKYDRTVPATPEVQRSAISRIINFAKNGYSCNYDSVYYLYSYIYQNFYASAAA